MAATATRATATPSQHSLIKQLLAQAGYDRGTVTRKYLRIGAADSWVGRPAEGWLAMLSYPEAERAIAQLQKDAAHGAQAGVHAGKRAGSRQ